MKNALFAIVHVGLALLLVAELAAQKPDQTTQQVYKPDQVKTPNVYTPDQVVQKTYAPDQVVQTKTYAPDQVVQKSYMPGPIWPSSRAWDLVERIRQRESDPCIGPLKRIGINCLKRRLGREIEPSFPPVGPW